MLLKMWDDVDRRFFFVVHVDLVVLDAARLFG